MTSSRWQHRSFLTLFSLTRRTNNYSQRRHHWENPRTFGWGWRTPCTIETKTGGIRRVRGAATCSPHCPSPRPAWHRGEISPKPLVPPVAKEAHMDIQLSQHCGFFLARPSLVLPHGDCRGIWRTWPLRISSCHNQHSDLGGPSSYVQCPSSSPSQPLCPSAESSHWHRLTWELSGVQVCLIWVLKQRYLALEPGLSPRMQGSWVLTPTDCWVKLPAPPDQKAWPEHLGSCIAWQYLSTESGRQSWQTAEQSQWLCSARELRVQVSLNQDHQQRAFLALELVLPQCPGREPNSQPHSLLNTPCSPPDHGI